jgi:hypothetical protein
MSPPGDFGARFWPVRGYDGANGLTCVLYPEFQVIDAI